MFVRILRQIFTQRLSTAYIASATEYHLQTPKFDGKEAALYAMKMSYLYKIAVLSRLGIDEKIYIDNLRYFWNRQYSDA